MKLLCFFYYHIAFSFKIGFYCSFYLFLFLKAIKSFVFAFRADSITWNPHKLLAAPQQCSTFLTKHEEILLPAHSSNATYLFQKDKFYDTQYDTGDKHIQVSLSPLFIYSRHAKFRS